MKAIRTRTLVILLAFLLGITASNAYQPAVFAAAGPDLTVEEISLSPQEPAIGDTVTITVAVKNLGDAGAGSSYMTCYIDDRILDTRKTDPIESGITATVTFSWTATDGAHTIKAIADANNVIPESNESNNTGTYSITTLAPDLAVQSITWKPENPARGDSVVFTITIKNQGNIDSRYTSINFYVDDGERGPQDITAIKPGNTLTKTYSWVMLEGSHTLKAVVDENNSNKESNEANNELTAALGTLPADLTVENIAWAPVNPSKDDIVSFNVTITNVGTGRADQSYLGYYIDGVFLDMISVPALDAGHSSNVTFTWKATLDAHNIKVAADYYTMVIETNEENNTLEVSLLALPPDLVISNVTWRPTDPAAGDAMTFTVYVKNQGGGRADPSRLIFSIDTKSPFYLEFPFIEAGAETSISTNWVAESGAHNIWLQADYLLRIKESKEDNNRFNTSFSVFPPDLLITGISYTPEKPSLDDTVTFTITIKNQGRGKAPGTNISYFIDDISQSISLVNPLSAGASIDLIWKWKVQNGHHTFKAVLDYTNVMMEENKKNNSASISIAPNMPDLSITNVTWSPAEIPEGEDIVFTIDIENLGGLTAEPSRLVYYVDNAVAGFNDIDAVAAGEKVTQSFTWSASEGRHSISIVADSKAQITEIDEVNNTVVVNIPPPDLVMQDVTYSPQDALTGDTVVISASIMNDKGGRTPESVAQCYVDGISIGVCSLGPLEAGEKGEVSFNWVAEPGAHTFKVTADVYRAVMEINETNNEGETAFSTTTPDLVIDNVSWLTNSHLNSKEVSFTITVKNSGACDSGMFTMQCAFDNSPATAKEMASIPGGGTADFTVTPILSEGPHTANILLDINHEVSEMNEENNGSTFSFSTVAPDLIIRSITWSPMTANIGDNITISAKIENLGEAKAAGARFTLSIDGAEAGSLDIAEIDSGATASADFTWKALEGEHTIDIMADAARSITESNEANNTKSRTITFLKPAPPEKKTPVITLGATTGGGLLDTWWWVILLAGGALGLGVLYTTIRNMRKK